MCGGSDANDGLACNKVARIARGHARVGKYGVWAYAMLR